MIGVFDSGVGGLSVLKEIMASRFDNEYIYFGDTKNLPYGTKSKDEIINFTRNIVKFLISKGAHTAIIACNTTSALAYETLDEEFKNEIKIYPLIQTVAPFIAKMSDKIGIMATKATVKSFAYTKEILKANASAQVYEKDCSGLVEIVENRLYNDKESIRYIESLLRPLLDAGCGKIVLGCTHYPFLLPILKNFAPEDTFINPARILTDAIKNDFTQVSGNQIVSYYVSKDHATFKENAGLFIDIKEDVVTVNTEKDPSLNTLSV